MKSEQEKAAFEKQLKEFAATLTQFVAKGDEWTIRGFIDIFKNIYTISSDTKIISSKFLQTESEKSCHRLMNI